MSRKESSYSTMSYCSRKWMHTLANSCTKILRSQRDMNDINVVVIRVKMEVSGLADELRLG